MKRKNPRQNTTKKAGLAAAIEAWAQATTTKGARKRQLIRMKTIAVTEFFASVGKDLAQVEPVNVKQWQKDLEGCGLAPSTVSARISRVSSFYRWALKDRRYSGVLSSNPVQPARINARLPHNSKSANDLTEKELRLFTRALFERAGTGDLAAIRDFTIWLFLILTGRRQQEILNLLCKDLTMNGTIILRFLDKCGRSEMVELKSAVPRSWLTCYLSNSARLEAMTRSSPLWIRHDSAAQGKEQPLSGRALASRLRSVAKSVGISGFNTRRARDIFARFFEEDEGSVSLLDALGCLKSRRNRTYGDTITVHRDRHSDQIAYRLGMGGKKGPTHARLETDAAEPTPDLPLEDLTINDLVTMEESQKRRFRRRALINQWRSLRVRLGASNPSGSMEEVLEDRRIDDVALSHVETQFQLATVALTRIPRNDYALLTIEGLCYSTATFLYNLPSSKIDEHFSSSLSDIAIRFLSAYPESIDKFNSSASDALQDFLVSTMYALSSGLKPSHIRTHVKPKWKALQALAVTLGLKGSQTSDAHIKSLVLSARRTELPESPHSEQRERRLEIGNFQNVLMISGLGGNLFDFDRPDWLPPVKES